MNDYTKLTIADIRAGLREKKFSAQEIAREALKLSEDENEKYGAFLHFSPKRALRAAEGVDAAIAAGKPLGPLAGVPVAVKDVIMTDGLKTTCGSRMLENYVAAYDATAVIAPGSSGRRDHRQDQLRRVRHGFVERELRVRSRCAIRPRPTACPADRAAVRRRRWRGGTAVCRWDPTRADPSASRRRFAAWSA